MDNLNTILSCFGLNTVPISDRKKLTAESNLSFACHKWSVACEYERDTWDGYGRFYLPALNDSISQYNEIKYQ